MAASSVSAWGGCYSKDYTYDSAKQKLTTCVSYSKPGWSFETTYYGDAKISVTGSAMATLYELTGVYTVSALGITGASCGTSVVQLVQV